MDRLKEIFESMVDWYMDSSEEPLFMLVQGVVLGLVIAGAVWMLCKTVKVEGEEYER